MKHGIIKQKLRNDLPRSERNKTPGLLAAGSGLVLLKFSAHFRPFTIYRTQIFGSPAVLPERILGVALGNDGFEFFGVGRSDGI